VKDIQTIRSLVPCSHVLPIVALLVVFGIVLPWLKGVDFLDPVMTGAYACLGGLFAAPHAAHAFERDRPAAFSVAIRGALRAAAFGEGLALTLLAFGILTVNLSRPGRLRLPELDTLAETGLLGLAMTLAFALGSAWISIRFSPNTARRISRFVFLALAVGFYYDSRWLPDIALRGALTCVILVGSFSFLLHKQITGRQIPRKETQAE
jgi:hypothetical protein